MKRPILSCIIASFVALAFQSSSRGQQAEEYVLAIDVQIIMPQPSGVQASAVAHVSPTGSIDSIKVVNPGSGYGLSPWITVDTPLDEKGATPILGTPVIQDGAITEIKIENGGSGYSAAFPPQVWIDSPNRRAQARAVLSGSTLTGIEIIDPGSGYVSAGSNGFVVNFNPKKNAQLTLGANALVHSGLGKVGQLFPVLNGEGYSTLRGLPVPTRPDAVVRALGYYTPGDGGGGMFFWNPDRTFAMARQVSILDGGVDYRPGDLVLLNGRQRFLVTEVNKRGSTQFPDGLYTDYTEVAPSGKVDVGAIAKMVPVEYTDFATVPTQTNWVNSSARWSESPDIVVAGWDAGNGALKIVDDGKRSHLTMEQVFAKHETIRGEKSGATGEVGGFGADSGQFWITLIKSTVSGAFVPGERLMTVDGPGSGQPFVKGSGPLDMEVAWTLDDGGCLINPCGNQARGRWERCYENDRNDIRFFGAVNDSPGNGSVLGTDNTWAIQMAIRSSWGGSGTPAASKTVFIPGLRSGMGFLTGPLNDNYNVNFKGDGGGMLVGMPGQDVIKLVQPPADFPSVNRGWGSAVFDGFSIMVNESVNPTLPGGIADARTYKARRLYKAGLWDKEHNSQRWGTMTFMAAEPVTDRRYFGTDDSLDPEEAPPINDREPARRIYYIINDPSAHNQTPSLEYSDRVVSLEVNPQNRGYATVGEQRSLDGGVPVLGSLCGPGPYGDKSNFGNLDAGKAQIIVDRLFVPESVTLSHEGGSGAFTLDNPGQTPLLENQRYTFAITGRDQGRLVFDTVCKNGELVLNPDAGVNQADPGDIRSSRVTWIAGPVASVHLVGGGSYKYKPGEEAIRHLRSIENVLRCESEGHGQARLYFGSKPLSAAGFTVGMAVMGEQSGAYGTVTAFGNDGTSEYVALSRCDSRSFQIGEAIVPAFNTPGQLGLCTSPRTVFDVIFASDNPVAKPLVLNVSRSAGTEDVISLAADGAAPDKKDYYPWKVTEVSDADGKIYLPNLDYVPVVDPTGQKIVLQWGSDWPGKSREASAPTGNYKVSLLYYAGSPTYENLPWPEWQPLTRAGDHWGFKDPHFLTAKDGRIVVKGPDGLVTGNPLLQGRDYTVDYDKTEDAAMVQWKPGITPPAGNLYIKYRKAVDDYEHEPWGSPKHLSGFINNAVLVDAFERYMGNYGIIQQELNYPGYPPVICGGCSRTVFRNLWIGASGARQSTSGAINLTGNYNGIFENLELYDTNYGLVMPINLYYPWQNSEVRNDGSVRLRPPYSEGLAEYSTTLWGNDPLASVGYYTNKAQYLYSYSGGSEQANYKGFLMRCGDIGIFTVGSAYYGIANIWASGAGSIDRVRGNLMFFGKPARGPERFAACGAFGPAGCMFAEQATNGDYAVPVIRCALPGGGSVDLGGATQARQVIWTGHTTGKAAGGRATVMLDLKYGMGIWGPTSMRVSTTKGSKQISIDSIGTGPDGKSAVPLRDGGTYYFYLPDPTGIATVWRSFTYDAKRPLNDQELGGFEPAPPPNVTLSNYLVSIYNSTVLKLHRSDINDIEADKINQHYGWSLLLCGGNNQIEVAPSIMSDRKRCILEPVGFNRITDGILKPDSSGPQDRP